MNSNRRILKDQSVRTWADYISIQMRTGVVLGRRCFSLVEQPFVRLQCGLTRRCCSHALFRKAQKPTISIAEWALCCNRSRFQA